MTATWPNSLDTAVLNALVSIRSPDTTVVVRAVTVLGNTVPLVALTAIAVWLLVRAGRTAVAVFCAATTTAGWLLMLGAKELFGRARPAMPPRLVEIDSLSFPSGHAMNSMVVYGAIAVAAYLVTGRRWPLIVAGVGTLAVGMSRVYLAAHWFTDVLAGWALGVVVLGVGLLILRRAEPRAGRVAPPDLPGAPHELGN